MKGGIIGVLHTYPSEMAQTFWTAIVAFSTCAVVSVVVSLATRPRPDDELRGLVYALTPRPSDAAVAWYNRPAVMAAAVLGLTVAINLVLM